HFIDIKKGIQEMKRVLKDDGTLLIMVPNAKFIYWKVNRMKGTEQHDISEALFTLEEWQKQFEAEGLKVLKVDFDDWFLHEPISFKPFSVGTLVRGSKRW